jgi:nitrate reductase gamma subunit
MTNLTERRADWIVGRAALICGVLGVVAGFVRGLFVYAPTAWAAAIEVGIPAAAAGAILGLGIVGVRTLVRRVRG